MLSIARRLPTALAAALVLGLQPGCARNPVTGDLQLALVSESQEVAMGQQAAEEARQSIGVVDDPALQEYVSAIGQRMAAVSERPELPWSFTVVDDPTPNAFALPGGPVFVTRGMMDLMSTEAQLASVLGHEIGHITARHSVSQISRAQLAQIGLVAGSIFVPQIAQFGDLASAGLQLLFLSNSRDAERQADELGFGYSLNQGYNVSEMALVFGSLQRLGEDNESSAVPSWLLTHPQPAERVQSVQERLDTLSTGGSGRIGRQPYLERIQGLVYGDNPRDGYFRDGLFLHPELRFQVHFPDQWTTRNLSQAVMAVSPQQNAALQLTLAQDASPETAARRFFSQQGIQQGQASSRNINGQSGIISVFRAQTQEGVLDGLVAFIAYDGRVYQLIGYAPSQVAGNYGQTFEQSLLSFAPLTDPDALNVQPDRMDIVRTSETMTLDEFNRRYPSAESVTVHDLAILNQIADGNSIIPGGSLVKRVLAP